MKLWAIRHKPTGGFMPTFSGRAGGTHVEPTSTKPPRLFGRHQDAKAALDWWLEGKVTARYSFDGEFDGDLSFKKQKHRTAEDMEIIEVTVSQV